jgi:hypothetical protein
MKSIMFVVVGLVTVGVTSTAMAGTYRQPYRGTAYGAPVVAVPNTQTPGSTTTTGGQGQQGQEEKTTAPIPKNFYQTDSPEPKENPDPKTDKTNPD